MAVPAGGRAIFSRRLGNTWSFRSGGLGDFLLTIPFLKALRQKSERLTVVTRQTFRALVEEDFPDTLWLDSDGREVASLFSRPEDFLCQRLRNAHVFSFVGERDGDLRTNLQTCGCESVTFLNSRPEKPPHVTEQMFRSAQMSIPSDLKSRVWLMKRSGDAKGLWVHPGSGAPRKNAPLQAFRQRISVLMSQDSFDRLYVLMGEAERPLHGEVVRAFAPWNPTMVIEPPLPELRRLMEGSAGRFIGNDSGPCHLAAMLGIPVEVFFVTTIPDIWRPLGPYVTVMGVRASLP